MSDDEAQNLTDLYTIEYFSAKAGGEGECKDYIKIKYDPKFKDKLSEEDIGDERIWEIDNFIKMMNKGDNFEKLWEIGNSTLKEFGTNDDNGLDAAFAATKMLNEKIQEKKQ